MILQAPPLSKARSDALADYVELVRAELMLQHWRIDLPDEYPTDDPDEVLAQVEPAEGRYIATIRFGASFWRRSRDEQRGAIVHELLHLHHVRLTDIVRLGQYRNVLGQPFYDHLWASVKSEAEYMTDALTTIIEARIPLPPKWPL